MSESRGLTVEESALLLVAVLAAAAGGDEEASRMIAELANDPDRIAEIVAGDESPEGGE